MKYGTWCKACGKNQADFTIAILDMKDRVIAESPICKKCLQGTAKDTAFTKELFSGKLEQ